MTKLYIAGPMSGHPESNYPAFNAAANDLRRAGHEVLNPVFGRTMHSAPRPNVPEQDGPWADYMRNALNQLIRADGLALLPGWLHSRGATLEVYTAHRLGMEVRDLTEWTGTK